MNAIGAIGDGFDVSVLIVVNLVLVILELCEGGLVVIEVKDCVRRTQECVAQDSHLPVDHGDAESTCRAAVGESNAVLLWVHQVVDWNADDRAVTASEAESEVGVSGR